MTRTRLIQHGLGRVMGGTSTVAGRSGMNFSSRPDDAANTEGRRPRPWLNPQVSWENRVTFFCESRVGDLNPAAIHLDAPSLLEFCCRQGDVVGMKNAQEILDRCLAEKDYYETSSATSTSASTSTGPFPIPLNLFQSVLYGWACLCRLQSKVKVEQAMIRMRQIVDQLLLTVQQEQQRFPTPTLQPTIDIYNTYLTGLNFASKVDPTAAEMAERLLDEMILLHQKHHWHVKPNTKSYTLVMSAYTHSRNTKTAGPNAERILRKLQQVHATEKHLYQQQYDAHYDTQHPQANKRRIPTPDTIVYNHVIQAYAKDPSVTATHKARDLLIEAMSTTDGTVRPDLGLFTGVIAAFAHLAGNPRLSLEERYHAAMQAEEVMTAVFQDFQRLDHQHKTTNSTSSSSNTHRVAPFNACMNAFARSGSPDGAIKAETMLQKLLTEHMNRQGYAAPDTSKWTIMYQFSMEMISMFLFRMHTSCSCSCSCLAYNYIACNSFLQYRLSGMGPACSNPTGCSRKSGRFAEIAT